jgi:PTH1 family peptidyl-tRNA hydrolase
LDWQRVLLGIGNPGDDYHETRHNVGFMVLDQLADRLGLTFRRLERKSPAGTKLFGGRVKAQVAMGVRADGTQFLLVKPQTYVNLSGDVAGPLMRVADLGPDALFVIVDDLNLPLGRIRVRPAGSSGGHNGLRSIEQALATAAYPRLRLGIGESVETSVVAHVLAPFSAREREVLAPNLTRAVDAAQAWLEGETIEELMCRYNGTET